MPLDTEGLENVQNQKALQMLIKIMPVMQKVGFSSLKIEEIAKYMDVSKATMYKYFPSKDAVIEGVIEQYSAYLHQSIQAFQMEVERPGTDFLREVFEKSLMIAMYVSDVFLQDLRAIYPSWYDELSQSIERWDEGLRLCMEKKIHEGILYPCNPSIVVLQLDTMLRKLLDMNVLMRNDLTMQQALSDFYFGFKQQVVRTAFFDEIDDEPILDYISYIVKKITR